MSLLLPMKFEAGEVEEKVVAVSVLVLVVGFLVEVFAAVVNIDVVRVMGLIPIVVVEMVGFVVLLFIVVVCDSCSLKTWTLYSVSFASPCLTIRENRAVVALHATVGYGPSNVVED